MRTSVLPMAAVATLVLLGGCADGEPSPTATTTARVTVTAPGQVERLSLKGTCDRVVRAFRDGDQPPREAFDDLAHEVQGVADAAGAAGRAALAPLIAAAEAGATAERPRDPRYQSALNRAHAALRQTCREAGSTALDDDD